MRINIEVDELLAFLVVADKLNFKAAAEELFISQPALSRRIARLEAALGGRLLERTTRRVSLTVAGMQFLPHARAAIGELETAIAGITDAATRHQGLVTVATVPSLAHRWLPEVLRAFAEAYPNVRVKVIDENAAGVLDSVIGGVADFGLNFIGAQEADIEFRAIYREPYVLAVRRDHALARRSAVAWDELADERLISVSANSGNRALIDNALARMRRRPAISYEANHVAGALGLVAAGLGVAALPSLAVRESQHPLLVGVPLAGPRISRTLGIISRKGATLAPAAKALYGMLARHPIR